MSAPDIRMPVFAGKFYPASAQALKKQIQSFLSPPAAVKQNAIACLLPHAGYIYSGGVAAQTVSRINIKDQLILFGPNHTGYGKNISVMTEGSWQTPLGDVKIDSDLAREILQGCPYLEDDNIAHQAEHSLEVELPILQYFKSNFKMVPIVFSFEEIGVLKTIGQQIAVAIKKNGLKDKVLLVASSDMTHYEPEVRAQKNDRMAIEAILNLDEERLALTVERFNISMCGVIPTITMLSCAKALGATRGELVKYQTSGDVTEDKNSVVGYAGITIF